MFQPYFAPPRDKQERPAALPHRLAVAAAAVSGSDGSASPRSPTACSPKASRLAATSSRLGSPRHRAPTLPAYRSLPGRAAGSQVQQRLPHVRHVAEERPPAAYTSLEHLRKIGDLHKGKHSTVCSYLDTRAGSLVAVKTYYKRTMAKRHYRNVRREVTISRLLAKQRFSGAVQLLGAFEDEAHIYLVQEFCAGGDLYTRLVRGGGLLGEAEVCRDVAVPLLLTLSFLHASHIVHRDIKPENIFFTADGGLRLGDFGLSIDARVERPTSRVGTLDYMAPEVVGMPSPDDIQRLGLAPHQIGHYGSKVDVWAMGILTYELICGKPPFEVEDVKLTEQHIKFGEVEFPPRVSSLCRSFIQQALIKRPESRPSAAQLFQHPWVRGHYQRLLVQQQQQQHSAAAVAAAAAAAAGWAQTPELRRTVSQPPSPSKSMPEAAARLGAGGATTPAAVASALAPFLPLSQAKMAHKVRLLSPGRPPSSSKAAGARRRRVSDPLARVLVPVPAEEVAAASVVAAAADVPPTTPPPAVLPAAASDGGGAVAAAGGVDDVASSSTAQAFETPGTPGVKVTPLPRQRPVVVAPRTGPLGRPTPFLLPSLGTPGGGNAAAAGEAQPSAPGGLARKGAAPGRSRFAAAAAAERENDGAAALHESVDSGLAALGSPLGVQAGRSSSLTSLAKDASSGSLQLAARASSFTSFGGGSTGNLQLAARASSFTSFGGSSCNLIGGGMGSRPASFSKLVPEGLEQQQAPACDGESPQRPLSEQLHRLRLV